MIKQILTTQKKMEATMDGFQVSQQKMQASLSDISDSLKALTTDIDKRFNKVDKRFNEVNSTLDYLVTNTTKLREDHDATIEWLKRHERRFDRLEAHNGLV
ncbi:MAG: hypothetical protein ABIG66_00205 [Candidatus Kerfeldbacteria bacterium]